MPTPHINAEEDQIADVVIMPGDPLRAKYIANNYLTEVELVNTVRNMLGFTGFYKGRRVTVIGSGMGCPSMGIYADELYSLYGVEKIIRVGTCGCFKETIDLKDIILVDDSYSLSSIAYQKCGFQEMFLAATDSLNNKIVETAKGMELHRGRIYTADCFANDDKEMEIAKKNGCLGIEMESFALFLMAKINEKEAACILTVSDKLVTGEKLSSSEREKSVDKMIVLALESIL